MIFLRHSGMAAGGGLTFADFGLLFGCDTDVHFVFCMISFCEGDVNPLGQIYYTNFTIELITSCAYFTKKNIRCFRTVSNKVGKFQIKNLIS